MKPEDYMTHHMVSYKAPNRVSYYSVDVLDFLNGSPWNEVALGYVHSLRPSSIRVTTGRATADARTWRVTVYVNDDNIIQGITQEVEVGLPKNVHSGDHLAIALKYGIDSERSKWYDDDNITAFHYDETGLSKLSNGEYIPFPKDED